MPCGLSVLVLVVSFGIASCEPRPKPNIVLVMTDDQTLEAMRFLPKTRALLGDQGTTFTNSFVNFPLCCPSRATLLTGQYMHNHGVQGNNPPTGGYSRLDHTNTLPVWLRDAGYATAHVGKYLNGYGAADPQRAAARVDRVVRPDRSDDLPGLRLPHEPERRGHAVRPHRRRTIRPTSSPTRPST